MLMKREAAKQVECCKISNSFLTQTTSTENCSECIERSLNRSGIPQADYCCSSNQESQGESVEKRENCREIANRSACCASTLGSSKLISPIPGDRAKKKARKSQHGQLSLRLFFQKSPNGSLDINNSSRNTSLSQEDVREFHQFSNRTPVTEYDGSACKPHELNSSGSQDQDEQNGDCPLDNKKNSIALLEWQRIQQLMENSIPLCKGHKEPCVARVVKKPGPTFGRRFYVCARAEGPASNPEANCGYFKWASSKPYKSGQK